jgi:hypothetical protein
MTYKMPVNRQVLQENMREKATSERAEGKAADADVTKTASDNEISRPEV